MNAEIKDINKQITFRIDKKIESAISLSMFNKNLKKLVENLNRLLSVEEKSRMQSTSRENKIKEMITNISHDLRTPLAAVKGYMEYLDRSLDKKQQKETAATILKHVDQLDKLINSFFEISYLEVSDDKVELSKVNLTNTVCNTMVNYIYQFEKKEMSVEINTQQPFYIMTNEGMLIRIIENLIKNCLVHADSNVNVSILEENKNVVLSFANKVKEPEKIDVDNLFDVFYVADKSRNKTTTGLGLSIVKKLCEKMDGSVKAILNKNILYIQVVFKRSEIL